MKKNSVNEKINLIINDGEVLAEKVRAEKNNQLKNRKFEKEPFEKFLKEAEALEEEYFKYMYPIWWHRRAEVDKALFEMGEEFTNRYGLMLRCIMEVEEKNSAEELNTLRNLVDEDFIPDEDKTYIDEYNITIGYSIDVCDRMLKFIK